MNIFRLFLGLGIALICGCGSSSKKSDELANLYLRMGTSNLTKGNRAHALRDLIHAEQLDPKNPIIQNNLGLAYFVNGNLELAQDHIEKALSIKSNYTDARNNLGRILIEKGEYSHAKRELTIVKNDLTYVQREKAWLNLGIIDFMQKNYTVAERKFLKAISIRRDYCLAHSYYGRSLYERAEYGRAATSLDKATQLCRHLDYDEPHFYSGLSHYKRGDEQAAISRLEDVARTYRHGQYASRAQDILRRIRR